MQTEMIKALMGAAGSGDKVYIDDVFKTYLYKGLSGQGQISSGIKYATEGGMVLIKSRTHSASWGVFDTERQNGYYLPADSTDNGGEITAASGSSPFLRDGGFRWNASQNDWNSSSQHMASYNFRKAKGFFDIVTYTANGVQKTISHSLGCIPGLVIIKNRSRAAKWVVTSSAISTYGWNGYLELDSDDVVGTGYPFGSHTPTATNFTITTSSGIGQTGIDSFNRSGDDYVAYLFADGANAAAQIFGEGGDQSIIKCGSYTGNGNADGPVVNLGWEPQWILTKPTSNSGDWLLFDTMRGITNGYDTNDYIFTLNDTSAENNSSERLETTQTGFKITSTTNTINGNTRKYLYLAIRRPDPKVAEAPTSPNNVFWMATGNGASGGDPCFVSDLPVDMALFREPGGTSDMVLSTRITTRYYLKTNTTSAESWDGDYRFDSNKGWNTDGFTSAKQSWMWRRHSGFDVVAYEGNGTAGHQVAHSLNKVPEMMWVKNRDDGSRNWRVYHKGLNGGTNPEQYRLILNNAEPENTLTSIWNDTAPTSTHFTLGTHGDVNDGSDEFIAILFASVDGISKVGYYTGTGSSGNTITVGFQPKFVIIKNTSRASTSWVVLDTLRGWGSGDDKSLELNETDAQETYNYGAPTSTGFTLDETGNWTNRSADVYVYYAHG